MTSTRRGALVLLTFAVVAVGLHLAAGNTFPVPWVDEIDFLAPAHALAHHGTLRVPNLAAPHGMFWVSDVYYFLLAPVVRFFPATVTVGRAVSLVAVVVAAAGFWTAGRKAGAHPVVAASVAGLWLVSPRVVIAGNITRHESIVLACIAWGLVAALSGRRVAAVTIAVLAAAVHPAGAPFALVVAVAAFVFTPKRATRLEWAGAAALGAMVAFEVAHFASNWSVATEQIRFQMQRKADRTTPARDLAFAVGFLVSLFAVIRGTSVAVRRAGVFAATAFAGAAVSAFGHEMWYGVYGLPTGLMLAGLALAVLARQMELSIAPRHLEGIALVAAALAIFAANDYRTGFYDMRISDDEAEWTAFVTGVEQQLTALDAAAPATTTVAINGMSDLPFPLVDPGLDNVTLVKETPVTVTEDATYQLVCCRPNVAPTHPLGEVVATVTSPEGLFKAKLVKIER